MGNFAVKKSRFTEEQIAFALKQAELGTTTAEICRKMGVSEATCYPPAEFAREHEAQANSQEQ